MATLSESRTNQLWATLAGMFGGERLARAFGKVPPREWIDMVGKMTDYELQRGVRRVMASGTEQIPTLPKFRRFCQESRNDDVDAPQPSPLSQLPSHLAAQDGWDIASNMHLMAYITKRLRPNPSAYGPVVPYDYKLHRDFGNPNNGSAQQQACTAILVKWKKHWAQMMREEATASGVDVAYQREQWDAYMRQAEEEIALKVMRKAA